MKGLCCLWAIVLVISFAWFLPAVATAALTWDVTPGDGGAITDGSGTWADGGGNWNTGSGDTTWNNASPTVAVFGNELLPGTSAATELGVVAVGAAETDEVVAAGLQFYLGYRLSGPGKLTLTGSSAPAPIGLYGLAGTGPSFNPYNEVWVDGNLGGGDIDVDNASLDAAGYLILSTANSWTGNMHIKNQPLNPDPNINTPNTVVAVTASDGLSPLGTVTADYLACISFEPPLGSTEDLTYSISTPLTVCGHGAGDAAPYKIRGVIAVTGPYAPNVNLSGAITLTGDSTFCTSNSTQPADFRRPTLTISGAIGGGSEAAQTNLYISGVGHVVLQGANTFVGDLIYYRSLSITLDTPTGSGVAVPGNLIFRDILLDNGLVNIKQNEQIADGKIIEFAYTGTSRTETVNLMDVTETVRGIKNVNADAGRSVIQNGGTGTATLVLQPIETLVEGVPTLDDYSYNGQLLDGATGGKLAVVKKGVGIQRLDGAASDDFTGGLTVEGGTLVYGAAASTSHSSPSIKVLSGATLDVSAITGYTLADGQTLSGGGTVVGTVAAGAGSTISPGASAGTLAFTGAVDMSLGGNMTWSLDTLKDDAGGGVAGTDYDLMTVTGNLTLGGTSELTLDFSAVGDPSSSVAFWQSDHSWKVVDVGGTTTGGFNTLTNGAFTAGTFDRSVVGNDVFLTFDANPVVAVPGDANEDGKVDSADASRVASYWGATELASGKTWWQMGDFNDDHVVNAADASLMAANWHYGVTEGASVPEPATAALLLVGLAGVTLWRRRGR